MSDPVFFQVAQVAVPLPIATTTFSYLIPEALSSKTVAGVRVRVPFRNREMTGYLVRVDMESHPRMPCQGRSGIQAEKKQHGFPLKTCGNDSALLQSPRDKSKLKPILAILDEQPVLSAKMLDLTKWVSEYYGSSWGEAIENALPRWVKFGKKTEKYTEKAKEKNTAAQPVPQRYTLSPEQKKAFEIIQTALEGRGRRAEGEKPSLSPRSSPNVSIGDPRSGFPLKARGNDVQTKPILIYGVTGSGKSELYIRTIRHVLEQGRGAICLVPEIALTEQLQKFFAGHFGGGLEILHSKMTDAERFLAWKRIELGTCRVVLGPRSAVFAPVPDLGLIIMDEEHEGSYKQETSPRYHAREVAAWRAQHENALFLMGTATPSLESMHRAEQGEITRINLTLRIDEKVMPRVDVIDLKYYEGGKKPSALFSPPLLREIETNLKAKEGTMLLLNRRGFSTSIRCPKCGAVEECKMCRVSLTFHQEQNKLLCHYCNYQKKVPDICSSCQAPLLRFVGFGTEKVESEVARFFPHARIARMDADTTKKKDAHEFILERFREQKLDILIGTQMIAKGFDFPHVTLVGVVLADVGLRLPDFRSSERTFQLLTQFAGRAGRGAKPGRVYIQTYMPDHPSILFAKKHDYLNYYAHEKQFREEFHYPPYHSLVNIIVRSRDEKKAYQFAREVRDALRGQAPFSAKKEPDPLITAEGNRYHFEKTKMEPVPFEIIGPAPLPFYKLRGHFRWHVMLKLPILEFGLRMGKNPALDATPMTVSIYKLLMSLKKPSVVAFAMDVDPLNIL